jgi:hypothetical protein
MRLNQSRRQHIGDGYGLRRAYVDQSGEGIMDIARNIYKKSKSLFGKASDLYSSEAGTIIKKYDALFRRECSASLCWREARYIKIA